MGFIRKFLNRFRRDGRGTISVELAIAVPVLTGL
jgi:Flp pilus assembly protein TadG